MAPAFCSSMCVCSIKQGTTGAKIRGSVRSQYKYIYRCSGLPFMCDASNDGNNNDDDDDAYVYV